MVCSWIFNKSLGVRRPGASERCQLFSLGRILVHSRSQITCKAFFLAAFKVNHQKRHWFRRMLIFFLAIFKHKNFVFEAQSYFSIFQKLFVQNEINNSTIWCSKKSSYSKVLAGVAFKISLESFLCVNKRGWLKPSLQWHRGHWFDLIAYLICRQCECEHFCWPNVAQAGAITQHLCINVPYMKFVEWPNIWLE